MTYFTQSDYFIELAAGRIPGKTSDHKFGRNSSLGTTYEPISTGGFYQTPTALTSVEILSNNAADTSAGAGARTVEVTGLSTDWNEVTETVTMNGTTPVTLANQYYRIYRARVATSGTYADQSNGSHVGDITVQTVGGGVGTSWAIIDDVATFPRGQTQIGAYTVPAGKQAFILNPYVHVDSVKTANITFFKRSNADVVAAPYEGMNLQFELDGVSNTVGLQGRIPIGPYPAKTDIGFLGRFTAGIGSVSVDFEIVLEDV